MKHSTDDLQDVLQAKNDGGSDGKIVSPFFLMGKRNRFAAFAVNSYEGKVHYILADGRKLRIDAAASVVYRTSSTTQFQEAITQFQQKLKEIVRRQPFDL